MNEHLYRGRQIGIRQGVVSRRKLRHGWVSSRPLMLSKCGPSGCEHELAEEGTQQRASAHSAIPRELLASVVYFKYKIFL